MRRNNTDAEPDTGDERERSEAIPNEGLATEARNKISSQGQVLPRENLKDHLKGRVKYVLIMKVILFYLFCSAGVECRPRP